MVVYIKLLMLCLLFLVFGIQKSSVLQFVNNGVVVIIVVKSYIYNVFFFDNFGYDLFDFNQGILFKKLVLDLVNLYKQGNNFYFVIKMDVQRLIIFKEDIFIYIFCNRVKFV